MKKSGILTFGAIIIFFAFEILVHITSGFMIFCGMIYLSEKMMESKIHSVERTNDNLRENDLTLQKPTEAELKELEDFPTFRTEEQNTTTESDAVGETLAMPALEGKPLAENFDQNTRTL